ncbi:MAG: hybrid sensor histidine kinase/response regulator [Aggregatilineales bacterium]
MTAHPPTILLVDDDDEIRTTASLILSLEGYRVVAAGNGQEALELIAAGKCQPQLIISDIAMSHMDGYTFLEAVRQMPSMRAVPFIFLTAFGSRKHVHMGRELGVDDYLVKPFEPSELIASVRSRLERAQEMRQQVEGEIDSVRRMLVQLLSHELRTPLTYITGGFELLADIVAQQADAQDVSVSIDLIRSGTQRLLRLAEQVVTYTELTSGFAEKQLGEFGECLPILEIVENALATAYPELRARRLNLETAYLDVDEARVYGLAKLLTSALYEVVRNAVTFSAEGGTIQLQVSQAKGFVQIVLVDHGCGIAEADLEAVWQIMAQSNRQRREQQGVGMGLPIVRQIMRLHGGEASLESRLGQGTTVTLRLPICSSAAGMPRRAQSL